MASSCRRRLRGPSSRRMGRSPMKDAWERTGSGPSPSTKATRSPLRQDSAAIARARDGAGTTARTGPARDGHANDHPADALCAAGPVAQLIGSVKLIDPADSLDETTARAIFRYATAIGRGRNDHPTVNGWF